MIIWKLFSLDSVGFLGFSYFVSVFLFNRLEWYGLSTVGDECRLQGQAALVQMAFLFPARHVLSKAGTIRSMCQVLTEVGRIS